MMYCRTTASHTPLPPPSASAKHKHAVGSNLLRAEQLLVLKIILRVPPRPLTLRNPLSMQLNCSRRRVRIASIAHTCFGPLWDARLM